MADSVEELEETASCDVSVELTACKSVKEPWYRCLHPVFMSQMDALFSDLKYSPEVWEKFKQEKVTAGYLTDRVATQRAV